MEKSLSSKEEKKNFKWYISKKILEAYNWMLNTCHLDIIIIMYYVSNSRLNML